jgi:hypothetical protein
MTAYLRGALVEFTQVFMLPVPNVIVFQYNPETMVHAWTQPKAADQPPGGGGRPDPLAVRGYPGESFNFTISMDANDQIADGGVGAPLAEASGVYTRLAALEMLLFPVDTTGGGLLGTVSASVATGLGLASPGPQQQTPAAKMPITLFVWGPGRILPVRVTSLQITEKLYDGLLNPIHAEAQLGLTVLTPDDLTADQDALAQKVALGAYNYTQTLREALALADLANAASSIVGMLPL